MDNSNLVCRLTVVIRVLTYARQITPNAVLVTWVRDPFKFWKISYNISETVQDGDSSHLQTVYNVVKSQPIFKIFCTRAYWKSGRNLLQNPYDITHFTLGMLIQYIGKLKIQSFCRCVRKRKESAFLIASNFVIHPQILIFSISKIASLSPYWLQIKFSISPFFYIYFCDQFVASEIRHSTETLLQDLSTINMVFSDEDIFW